ncbi:methyl-accepting chemotaxis protein [Desulfobacterales bacterium HSG17]|nr:methyl-accepting chemotaxis protein [Desulfobacterales bacterium HSG17]
MNIRISRLKITTKLFLINLLAIFIVSVVLLIVFVSFDNVKSLIATTFKKDISEILKNTQVGNELAGVFGNLLTGMLYGEEKEVKEKITNVIQKINALDIKSTSLQSNLALEQFTNKMMTLLEQSSQLKGFIDNFRKLESEFVYNLEILHDIIEEKIEISEDNKPFLSYLTQLQAMNTRYRETFYNIAGQVHLLKDKKLFSDKSELQIDSHPVVAALDSLLLELMTLAATDIDIKEQGKQLTDIVRNYKQSIVQYLQLLSQFQKQLIGMNKAKEDFMALLGKSNAEIISKTGIIQEQIGNKVQWAKKIISLLSGLIIFVLIMMTFSVIKMVSPIKKLIEQLTESYKQVMSASGQVSSASNILADGTSGQASSIEESSASLEELSAMTKLNADNASIANQLADKNRNMVKKTAGSIENLTQSMSEIADSSEEISKIIKNIEEIAFQTNLLALNAAIEAARAGETGSGFAVVAEEVRSLALKVGRESKNTSNLIESTVNKIKTASDFVSETDQTFAQVRTNAGKVVNLVGEIAAASQEQALGINQINKAVTEIERITQQNAASSQETAAASEQMNAQAEYMKSLLDALSILIGGKKVQG